jgi:hypothetical protein
MATTKARHRDQRSAAIESKAKRLAMGPRMGLRREGASRTTVPAVRRPEAPRREATRFWQECLLRMPTARAPRANISAGAARSPTTLYPWPPSPIRRNDGLPRLPYAVLKYRLGWHRWAI